MGKKIKSKKIKIRNAYGQWIDKAGVPHPKLKITLDTPAGYVVKK